MNDDQLSIFDERLWKIKIYDTYNAYKSIETFLALHSDSEALEEEVESLEKLFDLQSNQMVVLFCTYTEVMIKDFLYTIYHENPNEIEKYLSKKFLHEFKEARSKKLLDQELIEKFANIAAKKSFNSSDIEKTFNIICNLVYKKDPMTCEKDFEKTKENLIKIFKFRNLLVHQDKESKTSAKNIIDILYLKIALNFIDKLNEFCDVLNLHSVKEAKQKRQEEAERLLTNIFSL
jgi:hypothetical protein